MWIKGGNIFNSHHSQVPVVDEFENFYRIYYSTRIGEKSSPMFIDVDKKNPSLIINSGKLDIEWGKPGSFDWSGIMPTEIINYNGLKYLYYIGWSQRKDVPYHNNLGLLVSEDAGNSWRKFSEGPVFSTCKEEPGYIGTCNIIIENGIWRMWYLSCRDWISDLGRMEPTYDIKYAESDNGIDWNAKNITSVRLLGDEGGISCSRVLKFEEHYIMWFSVRNKIDYRDNKLNSYRIKTAKSFDGSTWIRDATTDLDISSEGWDDTMVCYPYVLRTKKGLIMFYNGNGFGKSGIGYAIKDI